MNFILRNIRTRLVWKLMISYLVVITIGIATLALATEAAIPSAFDRHMMSMQRMMGQGGMGRGVEMMGADLFTNFRTAVSEALIVSTIAALISAFVVSLFVSQRVVTPIRQMMEASRRMASGHYRERVDVPGEDELGQLAHSFNQMAETLEHTEAMRRHLIADVAHELRTPLSSIKGYMEGLLDGVVPTGPATYQQVYREADRLQRLVNDLQELSRVEAGAFQLERKPVALPALIQQITTHLNPQFEDKEIKLQLAWPDELPPVLADEDRLSQVLLNLIGNALQYTPSGGTVTITAADKQAAPSLPIGETVPDSHLVCTITDTGPGLSPEDLPHIFSRFYRVDKSRSRVGGGSGIGLTIARHLIEAQEGYIWASSRGPGQGSTFGFSLPRAESLPNL